MSLNLTLPASAALDSIQAAPGHYAVASLALAAGMHLLYTLFASSKSSKVAVYRLWLPFTTAWNFFADRHDFLSNGFEYVKQNFFQFSVAGHKIVAMRGDDARKVFFSHKDLSFTEGYRILFGGAPTLKDINIQGEHDTGDDEGLSWFQNRITSLLRKERLNEMLPQFFDDLHNRIETWPKEGVMNPFDQIYDLVFQLTVRAALCKEIADDPVKTERVAVLYELIEKGTNPKGHVFPWLPNKAIKLKNDSISELYTMISDIIERKKQNGSTDKDTIQTLLDLGDGTSDVVQFTLGTLFAGVLNTTNVSCWIPIFLDSNPTWKQKAVLEIRGFIEKYSNDSGSLAHRLGQVPATAWEDELPVIDAIIRETIRLTLTGSALRRNVKQDLPVGGKVIEKGAFMAFPFPELHFNDQIYSEPYKFDPDRYSDGREEDRKVNFGYLGWGVGRHPCLGMRFAKLELKMICAVFLGGFEYQHVDASGNRIALDGHAVNRGQLFQAIPKGPATYLKYKRVM